MKFKSLKARVLVWFGGVAFVVLTLFALFFNYFLNNSIDNNIKLKLQLVANNYAQYIQMQDVGIAILENGKVERKNSAFDLSDYARYLNKEQNFYIITHQEDDDYIDAVYVARKGAKQIVVYKKNIDNKIENFQDILLWIIPILLMIFIVLASKTIDKILQPINKLRDATKDITITRFTKELELPKEDDEIKDLVISFNAMIERIKEGVERIERFNSDVSHELRTPLTVIQGEIELTLRKLRQPQEYERTLKTIQKQSKQIELIVKQLLLLTKYSKENIQETFEECSLDSLLLNTVEKFESKLKEKNLHLQIDKIEPVTIQANPILISAVFDNLVDNAIKYTPKEKNITISLYQNDVINFVITDEGIGIEEEHLAKITQRFYRVDNARSKKIEGVGLGLSIVQNSVYLHGGELKITSLPGKGTRAIVSF